MVRGLTAGRVALIVAGTALLVTSMTPPAHAKGSKAAKRAKVFERKGKKAYTRQRWDEAIVAFELAYRADPKPKFLYNVVKSLQRKGDHVRALEMMKEYLEEETDEGERADAEAEQAMIEA